MTRQGIAQTIAVHTQHKRFYRQDAIELFGKLKPEVSKHFTNIDDFWHAVLRERRINDGEPWN